MQEQPQIKNPSITLYPFHLRDDGDEGYDEVARNAQSLWENLADNVGTQFNSNELKSLRDKLVCYKDKRDIIRESELVYILGNHDHH